MISTNNSLLSVVNLCLAGIGREPVPELDTPDLDSAMAIAVVEQASLDIQNNGGRGWWFNKEANWKLQVDERTGEIRVPNNTLSILQARVHSQDRGDRLTIRGNRVYDTLSHTFDLRGVSDDTINFTLVMLLPIEELPPTARSAIAWRARNIFISDVVGDQEQLRQEAGNEARAMQALTSENSRSLKRNALLDNPTNRNRLYVIAGVNNFYP